MTKKTPRIDQFLIGELEYTLVYVKTIRTWYGWRGDELKLFYGKELEVLEFVEKHNLEKKTFAIFEGKIYPELPVDNEMDLLKWFSTHRQIKAKKEA